MLAFLSRFWLDAQNTDLSELIKQKQAVLAASSNFENQFKDTQARLKIFSNFTTPDSLIAQRVSAINSRLPPDAILESVSFSPEGISINGLSTSERSIQQLIINLYAEETITEIVLQEVTLDAENQLLRFKISIPTFNLEKE